MPDTAIVLFNEENSRSGSGVLIKSGLLKRKSGMAIYRLIHGKSFKKGIRQISPEPGIEIIIIKLPFSGLSLDNINKQYLARFISGTCLENGCTRCFFPSGSGWTEYVGCFDDSLAARHVVFKALLIPILYELISSRGLRLDNLEIAIFCGNDSRDLMTVVRQLEPFIKYLNIAALNRESVERDIASIFTDSGLPVFVSSDMGSIARSADIIINLGSPDVLTRLRIRQSTLVINYGSTGGLIRRGEFPVINGIEFLFPEGVYKRYGEEILRNYSRAELSDILIALKAGIYSEDEYNDDVVRRITRAFNRDGCKITGFIGRRGILMPDEVVRAIAHSQ